MTVMHLSSDEAELYHHYSAPVESEWSADSPRIYTAAVSLRHDGSATLRTVQEPQEKSPPNKKRTKKVRFGKVIRHTYRQRQPSKAEKKDLWYSGKEIRQMRTEICALNMSVSASNPHQRALLIKAYGVKDSWRGLEPVRQGALLLKVEHRKHFAHSFLYFYRELGVRDPGALAVFCATNSQTDRQRAIDLAKQDAMDACQIYYSFLTVEKNTPEAQAAEHDGKVKKQTTPKGRRQRRQSKSTPRHNSERKPFRAQVLNLTLSL